MIQISDASESWPTDWHIINVITGVEARQISMDTFQLKTASHTVTLNQEGFNLYRSGPAEAFDKWLDEHHIVSEMRND